MHNANLSEKIKKIVRRAQNHCYKNVATNLGSEMPLVFAFDKGDRGGFGRFIKEATMFDHSADKIILIRLNSGGVKVKDREAAESIDAALCNVDICCKYISKVEAA